MKAGGRYSSRFSTCAVPRNFSASPCGRSTGSSMQMSCGGARGSPPALRALGVASVPPAGICPMKREEPDWAPRRPLASDLHDRSSGSGRSADGEPQCSRCRCVVVWFHGIPVCAACWAETTLALEGRTP